jgi:hypothetical protein
MKRSLIFLVLLLTATLLSAQAQQSDPDRGMNWYEAWYSSFNTDGAVNKLDSTVGYDFNKHVGVNAGLPLYFVHASNATTTGTTDGAGFGDFHAALLLRQSWKDKLNYEASFNGTAPTGSRTNGLSTGRFTIDWNNHFDGTIHKVRPFADLGLANTVPDSVFFQRPFTSLGVVGLFDGGAVVRVAPKLGWGVSAYAVQPSGNQKIVSRLVKQDNFSTVASSHGRVFQDNAVTSGNDLTRDRGFSTWVELDPSKYFDFQVGYTRSQTFDLNTFSFGIGFNAGKFFKRNQRP